MQSNIAVDEGPLWHRRSEGGVGMGFEHEQRGRLGRRPISSLIDHGAV